MTTYGLLSLLFWKISALFTKSRIHEHLQLARFENKQTKNQQQTNKIKTKNKQNKTVKQTKIRRYYHRIIHDEYI